MEREREREGGGLGRNEIRMRKRNRQCNDKKIRETIDGEATDGGERLCHLLARSC